MPRKIASKNRIKELDALRGIAAIMVVVFHYTTEWPERGLGLKFGVTGVDLFFMISGFVIYMSLGRVKNSLEFIINRTSRLYPTYWTCVTFTFIIICLGAHFSKSAYYSANSIWTYLANMTMFQYYLGVNDIDGPYWTMIVEMIFYIFILILLHFVLLKYVNVIGIAISIGIVIITNFSFNQFSRPIILAVPLLPFIPLFLAGTVFFKLYQNEPGTPRHYLIILLCLACQIMLFDYGGRSRDYLTINEYAMIVSVYFLVFTLFVNGKLGLLVNNVTLFLGEISYPLYLVHQFVGTRLIIPLLTKRYHLNYCVVSFLIALPVSLFLAFIIHKLVEVPLSRRVRTKLKSITFGTTT